MNREEIFLLRGFLPMEGDVLLPCPSDSYPMVFLLFSILGGVPEGRGGLILPALTRRGARRAGWSPRLARGVRFGQAL